MSDGKSRRNLVERGPPTGPVTTYFGGGTVLQIPDIVRERAWKRVLLVCGQVSFEASGAAVILPRLRAVSKVVRWSDFRANTDAADVRRGLEVLRAHDPDVILAVGGGSTIDMAKLLATQEEHDTQTALETSIRSGRPSHRRDRALVAVPTTSGTGSECTHFAVVYIDASKYSVAGQTLRPDAAVLDPSLAVSASAYQRATSGIDAVAQAMESLWAVAATPLSRQYARDALTLLLPAIEPFVRSPTPEAAEAMCLGAHISGRAIDISKTTAAHALSYALTQRHGVSHGHAVALTLGAFIERHAEVDVADLHPDVDGSVHDAVMTEIVECLGASDGPTGREALWGLMDRIGLATRLSDVGVRGETERGQLAQAVNEERLSNNPVRLREDELLALLRTVA